jgi:hypothetical protein
MEVKIKEFKDKTVVFYGESKKDKFYVYEINILPKTKVKKEKRDFNFQLDIANKVTKGDLKKVFECKTNNMVRISFKMSYPFVVDLSDLE